MTSIKLDPGARIKVRKVGQERQSVLTIDDCLSDAGSVAQVAYHAPFQRPPGGYYPGLNAPMPPAVASQITAQLRPILETVFGLSSTSEIQLMGYFGLATIPACRLHPIQRVPHFDAVDGKQLAILIYLCDSRHGGTAFYRHNRSGFETVDADRQAAFRVARDMDYVGLTHEHVGAATPGYSLISDVPAAFNRLVAYRSNALHSGLLSDDTLSDDPKIGRVTANIFARPTAKREFS